MVSQSKLYTILVVTGIIVFAAIIVFNTFFSTSRTQAREVVIGTLQGGISTLDVAEKLELGKDYGIRLKVVRFAKTPEILVALSRGEVDAAIIPAEMAAKLIEKGVGLKIVAVDMFQNQAIVSLEPSIKNPRDLVGRLVAAVVPSGTYKMFKAYMKTLYNISVVESPEPRKDAIAVVDTPPGSILVALEKREVDAAVVWEPFVSKALTKGAHIVASFQDMWRESNKKQLPVMLVWVARGGLEPSIVKKLALIQKEAATEWARNKTLVIQILTSPLYKLSQQEAEKLYERVVVNNRLLDEELVESIREVWRLAWLGGYLPENPDRIPSTVFTRE